ncbi:hypothetical protein HDV02_004291 [Globomyces sp. JEL0801]|nr:hypothetical protein HDV02_004291 [Globomyces sp. JEL0801]
MTPEKHVKIIDMNEEYVFKQANDDLVEEFLDHCHTVFNVPKQFFADHYYLDASRDSSSIVIACYKDRNRNVEIGAIGDVATDLQHRMKGLASKLLSISNDMMVQQGKCFGFLHTNPVGAAFKLYCSLGWCSWNLLRSTVTLNLTDNVFKEDEKSLSVQKLDFENGKDIDLIHSLHSRNLNAAIGQFTRPKSFWKNLNLRTDDRNQFVCLYFCDNDSQAYGLFEFSNKQFDSLEIHDFYVDHNLDATIILSEMIRKLLDLTKFELQHLEIRYATHLLFPVDLYRCFDIHSKSEHNDIGYMVKLLNPFMIENQRITTTEQLISALTDLPYKFIFSRADKF